MVDFSDLLAKRYEDFCSSENDGCFGLCLEVNKRLGKIIPDFRTLVENLSNQGKIEKFLPRFKKISDPETGDFVLIHRLDRTGFHVGVIIDRKSFLQVVEKDTVRKVRLSNPLVKDRIEGIYRYV